MQALKELRDLKIDSHKETKKHSTTDDKPTEENNSEAEPVIDITGEGNEGTSSRLFTCDKCA